jgi:hypothetical protein
VTITCSGSGSGHPSSTPNPDFRRFPRFNLNEINELEA